LSGETTAGILLGETFFLEQAKLFCDEVGRPM
jgi:hypothetical protein